MVTEHTDVAEADFRLIFRNRPSPCQLERWWRGQRGVVRETIPFLGGWPQPLPSALLAAHELLDLASYSVLFSAH